MTSTILSKFGKIPLLIISAITVTLMIFAGCSSNTTGTDGGGNGGGDGGGGGTTQPTFANVSNILESSCGGSGCHIDETTNGVRLDGYDNVMNSEGDQYGKKIVQAGEPDNSPLVDKIEASPEFGDRMPKGGSPLSDDQISLIRNWIADGAQNN